MVLEGCDRSGKSTQCRLLVDSLRKLGHSVQAMHFPGEGVEVVSSI